jgi:hypothetical protein
MWRVFYSNFENKTLIISTLDFILKMKILKKSVQNLLNHHLLAIIIN